MEETGTRRLARNPKLWAVMGAVTLVVVIASSGPHSGPAFVGRVPSQKFQTGATQAYPRVAQPTMSEATPFVNPVPQTQGQDAIHDDGVHTWQAQGEANTGKAAPITVIPVQNRASFVSMSADKEEMVEVNDETEEEATGNFVTNNPKTAAATAVVMSAVGGTAAKKEGLRDKIALALYFVFWYLGSMFYNQYNTFSLNQVGGKNAGLTMTVSTMQLFVCSVYPALLWIIGWNPIRLLGLQKPERMRLPKVNREDLVNTVPVGGFSAGAHAFGVACLGADPLFGQIVKAGEPVLSAGVNAAFYKQKPSIAKFVSILGIVIGVGISCLKKGANGSYGLSFNVAALIFGTLGSAFAAFKGGENKKLMSTPGIKDRYAGVANQFAVTEIFAFLISVPIMLFMEGANQGRFWKQLFTDPLLQKGILTSGLCFYLYNELSTMTIKATGALTNSVANTAKRVVLLVYMSAVTGLRLTYEQKVGAAIAIGFVFIYSSIDDVLARIKKMRNGNGGNDGTEMATA